MLTFIHISDTHISANPDYHPDWVHPSILHPNNGIVGLRKAIDTMAFDVDFILHTGDVCADPDKADYHIARDMLAQFDLPIYMIPGNHDSAELMCEILHDGKHLHVLGDSHIVINDYHLITLDTNGVGDTHAPTLLDYQINWLAKELQQTADYPIILATHHPLIETGVDWIDHRMRVQNGELVHQHLIPYANQLHGVFHGHIHQSVNSYCDGVCYTSAPSTWYSLQAYPSLQNDEDDLLVKVGFNLVLIRDKRTFIRRSAVWSGI